jgi:hypothetical protein
MQTVTGGISDKFSHAQQQGSNCGRIITIDRHCFYRSLSVLQQDEGQYSRLQQKALQYVYIVSKGQIIQPASNNCSSS